MIIKRYSLEEALSICENSEFYDADAIRVCAKFVGMLPEWENCPEEKCEDLYEEITKKARTEYNYNKEKI